MAYIPIDFEFFNSQEEKPTLVCAAMGDETYWLFDEDHVEQLKADIYKHIKQGDIFVAYYAIAEARSFLSLRIDPMDVQWIDLYAEFKMQQNCNYESQYGKYISKNGEELYSFPTKGEDNNNATKVPGDYINAVYKNLGKIVSSSEKALMRDLILSKNIDKITQEKHRIMEYCLEDTRYLIPTLEAIKTNFVQRGLRNFEGDMLRRGRYAAATAKCEATGIPINLDLLNTVITKTPEILKHARDNVNSFCRIFEDAYTPPPKLYKNGNVHTYKEVPARKNVKALHSFIESLGIAEWPKTDATTPVPKTDKETFETYRYIPAIEALYQCGKTESSMKWFSKENGDGFFDAFSYSDLRVRPFYGIFGTQTGRNAAKAKTFPFAMSKWLRAIVQPPKGQYIVAADFSQQEVAVAAALSGDQNLRDAYLSGDTYLAFAKLAGAVPQHATKVTHEKERDMFKSTKLGIQYGMGYVKLAHKLTHDCGRIFTPDEAKELINHHKQVFPKYWDFLYEISNSYELGVPVITSDGWTLWNDNPITTSVRNAPVQGTGAAITREAVILAWEAGLIVMCSLHDAIYLISSNPEQDQITLEQCMKQAVNNILGKRTIDIRIDFKLISHNDVWVEKAAQKEWDKINSILCQG